MKDCSSCPSFVSVEDAPGIFGKQTGVPMCKRYSIPLGRPGVPESQWETIQQFHALNCDSFGEPAPAKPVENRSYVMQPNASVVLGEIKDPNFEPAELNTCRNCKHLVQPDVVAREIGFPVELCRTQGKLVFRPTSECKLCPFSVKGEMSKSTDGLEISDEYKENFKISSEIAAEAVFSMGSTDVDPLSYKSDLPLSDEDIHNNILAWRKVQSPYAAADAIYLPIFDPKRFTDEQLELIPQTGDKNRPEQYVDYQHLLWAFADDCYELGEVMAMQGIPGIGKTEAGRFFAWLMQIPFIRFPFNNDSQVEDLIGQVNVSPEEGTYFIPGEIPLAFGQDAVILYDELNLAPNSVRQLLRPAFDKGTEMVVNIAGKDENGKKLPSFRFPRGKFTYQIVAQNPAHSVRNTGTEELASAEFDRMSVVNVELPPEAVERHIISMRCANDGFTIPEPMLDKLMAIAHDIREASDQDSIPFTWGIRQQIKVARKLRRNPLLVAYKRAALDFYEPEAVENILRAISHYDA